MFLKNFLNIFFISIKKQNNIKMIKMRMIIRFSTKSFISIHSKKMVIGIFLELHKYTELL